MVKPLDSIQHARDLLEGHRISHLPVVMNGRVIGIVTDRDLRDAFPMRRERIGALPIARRDVLDAFVELAGTAALD